MESLELMDKSPEKIRRRAIVRELVAMQPNLLATDYPGPEGRKFIRKLHKDQPKLCIELVSNGNFRKDYPGDSLVGVATKINKDIFDVIQYHKSELVDIDLFGGLAREYWEKIETAPNWRKLFITFSKTWRHKTKPGLLKSGEDPAQFMTMWCLENKWKPPIMPELPYRRPNKNAIMGLFDERGPKYWTFLIER